MSAASAMGVVAVLFAGCIPGLMSDGSVGPTVATPSDDVFITLIRAIEEERPDKFTAAVDPACTPPRDTLWDGLNAYIARADLTDFNVTVERRIPQENQITYVFTWQRKYKDRQTGETVTDAGRSEWTLARQINGPYLLTSAVGRPLF